MVRIAEIEEGDASAAEAFERALSRASPTLINVLSRYPLAPKGKSRAAQLMTELEAALRATRSLVLRIFDSALVGDAVLLALRPHGPIVSASPA